MAGKSLVFNIQRYSLHDGPGIRTVVFLKGCPLRCEWCCNPESQSYLPEIFYTANQCIGAKECGFCQKVCPSGAITFDGGALLDRKKCTNCFRCLGECPSQALKLQGKGYRADELADMAERDAAFYRHGGGGLTVSGGEPLTHESLLLPLLKEAKRRKLHTAIETCGYGEYSVLCEAAKYLDVVMYDIKSLDEKKHIEHTTRSNRRILENFKRLVTDYKNLPVKVRTPVIPGFNDSIHDIKEILEFITPYKNVTYEPLKYHSFGRGKYESLGRGYPMGDAKADDKKFEEILALCRRYPCFSRGAKAGNSFPV